MTKHGHNHNCLMCRMAKAVGMMEKGEQQHSITCSKCGLKAKSKEDLDQHVQKVHSMNRAQGL